MPDDVVNVTPHRTSVQDFALVTSPEERQPTWLPNIAQVGKVSGHDREEQQTKQLLRIMVST